MGGDSFDKGFCSNALGYYPIHHIIEGMPHDIGILMVVTGLVNIFMSLITIGWIKKNEYEAQAEYGREEAAKSVIFPVFVRVLWFTIASNIFAGAVTAFIPFDPSDSNAPFSAIMFAMVVAVRRAINEGIAFLLMQKGCGLHAANKAGTLAAAWGVVTFGMLFYAYLSHGPSADAIEIVWDVFIFAFYLVLWIAPQDQIFRRPALKFYSQFWVVYALLSIIIKVFFLFKDTDAVGNCAYVFTHVLLIAILSPLLIYWTLLQDSRWWQGVEVGRPYNLATESFDDIRVPLMGTDISLSSAQSLAATMDVMRTQRVKMLNFACIKIDFKRPLGGGSFSKVYKGSYRGKECAVKLIYTIDLTADVIQRVAAEASILSSIQHPNIVQIYGVSVLPPSVCLILEICHFGSLSDIIRGYGFDWNVSHRYPLTVSHADILHLALGCARGVAAIHALNSSICHRDIKSFNFLVDRNFNVKIADLELGLPGSSRPSSSSSTSSERGGILDDGRPIHSILSPSSSPDPAYVNVEERLANWLAPEVISDRRFQQASDVWALGTVLWELVARKLPFEHDSQPVIREKLLSGYQHPMPAGEEDSPLSILIQRCWCLIPDERPTAYEVVRVLENMLAYVLDEHVSTILHNPNIAAIRDFYESRYRRSLLSDDKSASVFRLSYHNDVSPWSWWWNPWRWWKWSQDASEDGEAWYREGGESLLRSSTYALPKVRTADLLHTHASAPSLSMGHSGWGNPLMQNSFNVRVPLREHVPAAVQEAIGQVKTERYWRSLEQTGDAWAAVSWEHPHVILHATSKWFGMFNACSAFGSDHHLWSLMSLMNPEQRAPEANCSVSNSYAQSSPHGIGLLQTQCATDFLSQLRNGQAVHGVLCFHMLDPSPRSQQSTTSRGSRVFSLRSRGSFSEAAGRSGHNMMCTIHAYPVFPPVLGPSAQIPIPTSTTGMEGTGAGEDGEGNGEQETPTPTNASTPPHAGSPHTNANSPVPPVSLPSYSDRLTLDNSRLGSEAESNLPRPSTPLRSKSASLFSRTRKSTQSACLEVSGPKPMYYLMQFNELLELNAPSERPSLRESLSGTFLSTLEGSLRFGSHSHSHRRKETTSNRHGPDYGHYDDDDDDEDEEDEEEDYDEEEDEEYDDRKEREGDRRPSEGYSFLGIHIGQFWTGTKHRERDRERQQYHSLG